MHRAAIDLLHDILPLHHHTEDRVLAVPCAHGIGRNEELAAARGEIAFTVRSFTQIPSDALVLVCFRWKRTSDRQDPYITVRPTQLDLTDGGRLLKVTVVVPPNLRNPPSRFGGDGE